jgi:hypothetical protein
VGRGAGCGVGIGDNAGVGGSGVCSTGDGISLRLESAFELKDPGMVLIGGALEHARMLDDLPLSGAEGPMELLLDEYGASD